MNPANPKFIALLHWYSQLTPDNLAALPEHYSEQARFKDPFNNVSGHAAIRQIFSHMFATVAEPRFVIIEQLHDAQQGFATWVFHFGLNGKNYQVLGSSHFRFAPDGRCTEHRDYWDPAEELWQKLPLIGAPVRWLRRRFVAHA
ncbi:nuclear transport factor 2 family protein [Chitinimonas sp.]|uniref:nuclear transport factor 2 family protein n=1 Tax=Chitinimonas sp. TaxID=1934313 RepID=UPI0035AE7231